jgi:predicted glycosyltransferase
MPKQERKGLFKRARKAKVQTFLFYRRMEKLMAAADLVVSMGGYNTISEVISQKTPSLIVPRQRPRMEQLIRARVFHAQGLVEYIPWPELSSRRMYTKIHELLEKPQPYRDALSRFEFTGIHTMRSRIDSFRSHRNVIAC